MKNPIKLFIICTGMIIAASCNSAKNGNGNNDINSHDQNPGGADSSNYMGQPQDHTATSDSMDNMNSMSADSNRMQRDSMR
jgi:hypothetical protein